MTEQEVKYESLQGTVSAVSYVNGGNGYSVLRLRTGGDTVTVVGCVPGCAAGEQLELLGNWTTHPTYGPQFSVQQARRIAPEGKKAIYEYLANGAVKGIGPATAAQMVARFGAETLRILADEPEKLSEIRGISPRKAQQMSEDYRHKAGMRRLMDFLASNGLRLRYALPLWRAYGDDAVDALRDDPYLLTRESFGADFYSADTLASTLGIEPDDPRRLEAAALFELNYNSRNGHVFLPREKLVQATSVLIGVAEEPIDEAVTSLCDCGLLTADTVAGRDAVYLTELYEAEAYVDRRLRELADEREDTSADVEALIARIEARQQLTYAGLQRLAVEEAAKRSVLLLTGGPGTGKTTAVRAITELFEELHLRTVLTAPTGRAAQRLSDLTGRDAATVHRLLGASLDRETGMTLFSHGEDSPLEAEAVIVDEASMLDVSLTASLLRAMRPGTRLVLVGDADQLPPVGPGCVFYDLLRSGVLPAVRLTEIFRQAKASRIVMGAHAVNGGECPELRNGQGDLFFLRREEESLIASTVTQLVSKRLPEGMHLSPERIQVLSPTRKGEGGTGNLNKLLQAALNPPSPDKNETPFGDVVFRMGDRVIQIRNNYDTLWTRSDGSMGSGVFNGDVGRISGIDPQEETVSVDFGDRTAEYPFEGLGELELAYAMTVHKSQGSEFDSVVLALPRTSPTLMTRSLLYTAMTRAKKLLVLVGAQEQISGMAKNDRAQRRYTGLKSRLTAAAE